jgi:hypothetical protein
MPLGRTSWWWELVVRKLLHLMVDRKLRKGTKTRRQVKLSKSHTTPSVMYFLK